MSGTGGRGTAPAQTAIDYVTIVLSPLLIMGLVGSLVFFLLEVFYHDGGPWKERLQWILFFYVFGIVLVARISMDPETANRFWYYGAALAGAAYLGVGAFVQYPEGVREVSFVVNLFLILVVWWCAHRLTWDCTNVDEEADMSGQGVLQAAGLEQNGDAPVEEAAEDEDRTLWQRWKDYQERTGKQRTLGVWVVYFSLAALPIFGLGQSLIPLTAPDRRTFAFWLMTIYVACGLGLLLTTCFLGLRRYLRQKRLQMPAAMTGAWLLVGGGLILTLVLLGAVLPRPYAEYSVFDLADPLRSKERRASRWAVKGDSPGKGEGQPGSQGKDQGKADGQGEGQDKDGKSGKGGDKSGDKDGKGGDKDGKGQDGKNGSDKDKSNKQGGEQDRSGKGGQDGQDRGKQKEDENRPKDGQKDKGREAGGQKQQDGKSGKQESDQQSKQDNTQTRSTNSLQQLLQRIGPWLKWIVFAILAIVVIVALLRGGLGFLANFSTWAKGLLEAWRRFWERLFGGSQKEEETSEEVIAAEADPPTPFSAYGNPFDNGRAERMPPRQLVRYTFAALEAWARERGLGRADGETAMEFTDRLINEAPGLEAEGRRLALLHARAEYAAGAMPEATPEMVRAFWTQFERVVESPLSA